MRKQILQEAIEITTGERQQVYGNPHDTFRLIAQMWSAYLETPVSEVDVCHMMTLLKIARAQSGQGFHADNFVDACGYQAIAAEIAETYSE